MCATSHGVACSTDHTLMLRCKGTAFAATSSCRGPKGCNLDAATFRIACDSSRARAGDPCEQENLRACSDDGRAELECRSGAYVKVRACPKACTTNAEGISCAP
jgi:hypothetical protein